MRFHHAYCQRSFRQNITVFAEEPDDEATGSGVRVLDYFEFTGFKTGISVLS
jgi:hypothetical protein